MIMIMEVDLDLDLGLETVVMRATIMQVKGTKVHVSHSKKLHQLALRSGPSQFQN